MKVKKSYYVRGDQKEGKSLNRAIDEIGYQISSGDMIEKPNNEFDPNFPKSEEYTAMKNNHNLWTSQGYLIPHPGSSNLFVHCYVFYPSVALKISKNLPQLTVQYFEETGLPNSLEEVMSRYELEEAKR
ncbi:hypothetical protein GOV14_03030 [Candidatus Pacearchaeota archaeon]|nr:hypothetical protein [Candidatus Pacearchaeota archaeon]